ncbi:GGDEF domain-containing protein [Sinanaerobacter chloroacetimidivorans]|jgi:diguanylate cyclase (GGDEF)-like protein|uniref:GGDEF domain-containing protein n=1 Tax=Sinanaerobacter chloroacetimidivorans TaxID=2818044 RepID=A0A8J7W1D3_9FIRM|nr:GGDEF domain-containing protein [Sinanaerobacter chloroacetimidivorans]MBR0597405.1 GGDEF domain-containing protein [Sinanaerobacter chloroacetimidivorans]
MEDIFEKEGEVIVEAENLLQSKVFSSFADEDLYRKLLAQYKRLLRQMRTMVKMSDIMQSKLNSMSGELEQLSQIDGLTGLYNRRFFNETYQKEWNKAVESQSTLGILMIDIDHFKKYNDSYGHLQGDKCLQIIASTIEDTVKGPNTFVARFGGEEFVVLLLDTNVKECTENAERVLTNIEQLNIVNKIDSIDCIVSVSIGIGYTTPDAEMKMESLLNVADQALYRAKKDGRRCYR